MRRTPSHSAATRWRWSENRRVATVRRVRRACHRASSGPVPNARPVPRTPRRAARRADGSDSGCAAMTSIVAVLLRSIFRGHFNANPAIAGETAGLVEHRFTAHPKLLLRAVCVDAAEGEVQERLAGCNL